MTRLRDKYTNELMPAMIERFEDRNVMALPKVEKVVVNVGLGMAIQNAKLLDIAAEELSAITGQKPIITRARRAIAGFKLRAGMPIGLMVTLRGDRMYEFLDRFINICLPRVRDFRGVSPNSFDGRGNYTIGIKDQLIFPEIDLGKTEHIHGMNITVVVKAQSDEEARFLLAGMGMPFAGQEERRMAIL